MQLIKEYVFFDLTRCINEIYALQYSLSKEEIGEIGRACEKLQCFIEDKQPQFNFSINLSV